MGQVGAVYSAGIISNYFWERRAFTILYLTRHASANSQRQRYLLMGNVRLGALDFLQKNANTAQLVFAFIIIYK